MLLLNWNIVIEDLIIGKLTIGKSRDVLSAQRKQVDKIVKENILKITRDSILGNETVLKELQKAKHAEKTRSQYELENVQLISQENDK